MKVMRFILLWAVFFLLCNIEVFAAPWRIIKGAKPLPHLRDIAVVPTSQSNNFNIYSAGFNGIVYFSKNNGKSWNYRQVAGKEGLYTTTFISPAIGWVGGWGGAIYKTIDGARHWIRCNTGTRKRITAFCSYKNKIIAVGDEGIVLWSKADGTVFHSRKSLGHDGLRSIEIAPSGKGLIVGYNGSAWWTDNAGKSWRLINEIKKQKLTLYGCALNEKSAWVVGAFGTVLRSNADGNNWQRVNLNSFAYLRHILFFSQQIGYITGYGVVFQTLDGGKHWRKIAADLPYQLIASASAKKNDLWIAGEYGILYHWKEPKSDLLTEKININAGLSEPVLGVGTTFLDITIQPETGIIWTVGEKSTVVFSKNKGETWTYRVLKQPSTLYTISFLDRKRGWIGGSHGDFWQTLDGGKNWQYKPYKEKENIYSIYSHKLTSIWLCGQHGLLYKSANKGKTWLKIPLRFRNDLRKIVFRNENQGWIVGEGGLILSTKDGGKFFLGNYTGIIDNFYNCSVQDENVIVIGRSGLIFETRTAGQGSSWNKYTINDGKGIRLNAISRNSSDELWVAGDGGQVWFRKADSLWQLDKTPTFRNLTGIISLDNKKVISCGENGLILVRASRN